jgi:predicted TIM-barrel fold metal-dependent hydrolase
MRVDVHAHYLTPEFFGLLEELDAPRQLESYTVFGPLLRPTAERLFAAGPAPVIEDWITQMDDSEIDLAIVSVGALQPYFAEERTGAKVARATNLMQREAVNLGAGRIAAFAALPLPHLDAALAELEFAMDECGFAGVTLGTSVCGEPLDAPAFDQLWAALDERHAIVFIHPGTTPVMAVGSADFMLAPIFVSPTETAVALCRLVASRLTLRHPHVQIISVAFGGALPFFAHRFDTALSRVAPDVYAELGGVIPRLRDMWFDTSMADEPFALDTVRQTFGVDRLVFGSDLPRGPLAEMVQYVTGSPLLDDAEKAQVFEARGALAELLADPSPIGS